jgi:hypothetical protein
MHTTRVNGPIDPIPTSTDVVVTKQYTYFGTFPEAGSVGITSAAISAAFPRLTTSGTPFDRYRLIKVSVFGATNDESIAIDMNQDQVSFGDNAFFIDYGTAGSRRPAIHISPAFSIRQSWNVSTNGIILFTISGTGEYVLQLTVEMRSLGIDDASLAHPMRVVGRKAVQPANTDTTPELEQ